ncbi:hypothetical protein VTO42DRAFT_7979 [Malbranchea cinnamomea]
MRNFQQVILDLRYQGDAASEVNGVPMIKEAVLPYGNVLEQRQSPVILFPGKWNLTPPMRQISTGCYTPETRFEACFNNSTSKVVHCVETVLDYLTGVAVVEDCQGAMTRRDSWMIVLE